MRKLTYLAAAATLTAGTLAATAPVAQAQTDRYVFHYSADQVATMHDNLDKSKALCDGVGLIKGATGDAAKLACGLSRNAQGRMINDAYNAHKGMECTYVEEDVEDFSHYECSVA